MMKNNLGLERLEDRKALAAYSVDILDQQNLVPASVENQMRSAANYVMQDLAKYVVWKGSLDLRINVLPPLPPHDGITPAILQNMPDPKGGWRNATVNEMLTGVDVYPDHPDVGMNVHLGNDGTVKLYGMPAYFDPDPVSYVAASVPAGQFDFIGVLRHEVAHGIGFQWGTNDFSRHVIQMDGNNYFNGPNTVSVLGKPLPMTTFGGTHYGNNLLPGNPVFSGLMYQWGNYGGNRLDWGRLDLAILKDVGLNIKDDSGLPLVDRMDYEAPKLVSSGSSLDENLPAGTTLATVGANQPGKSFTFQIVPGWDSSNFRISGRSVVSTVSFDYENKSSYTIYVRMIESGSNVWTDSKLVVRINDVKEAPVINVPQTLWAIGGTTFYRMSVSGDNRNATVVIFSRSGMLRSYVSDPNVRVHVTTNKWGGTTLSMVGTPANLTKNFKYVFYKGTESSINVSMCADGRNCGGGTINLRYA